MRFIKKFTAFLLSCLLLFSVFTVSSFAVQSPVNEMKAEVQTTKSVTALKTAHITGVKTEDGYVITCDLLQQSIDHVSSRSIAGLLLARQGFV